MNIKVIRTQNGELINFANIIEVSVMSGETQESGKAVKAFGVVAVDTLGKERQLLISETEDAADKIFNEMTAWVAYSTEGLFDFSGAGETER